MRAYASRVIVLAICWLALAICWLALADCRPALGADAAGPLSPVTANCQANGGVRLTRHFSGAQLQHALNTMPASTAEYSNCIQVIHNALLAELGHQRRPAHGAGGSTGGSFLSTPVLVVLIVVVVGGGVATVRAVRRR